MKISESNIELQSQNFAVDYLNVRESFELKISVNENNRRNEIPVKKDKADKLEINSKDENALSPDQAVTKHLLEDMLGMEVNISFKFEFEIKHSYQEIRKRFEEIDYEYELNHSRTEILQTMQQSSFSASGRILTQDGKEINFELNLELFSQQTIIRSESLKASNKKDPLVIHFEPPTGENFKNKDTSIDLDGDGNNEQIATPGNNAAFLTYDVNNNGRIDKGNELFGPKTGGGFEELRAYDDDQNDWIDENDRIFGNLRLWDGVKNRISGRDSLKNHGIGAIYVGKANMNNNFYGANSLPTANLKNAGIYLNNSGKPGIISEVDLFL
jgi:hypothetical protein